MTSIDAPSSAPPITTQPHLSTSTEELNPVSVEPSAPVSLTDVDPAVITSQPLMNPEEKVEEAKERFNQFNPTVPPPVQPPPVDDSGVCCLTCFDCLDCTLELGSCCVDCGECCANCCSDGCETCGHCCTSCCETADTDTVNASGFGDCCISCFECCGPD